MLTLESCARFRIEELEPALIASLKVQLEKPGSGLKSVHALYRRRVIYNFPIKPVTDGNFIFILDPAQKLVRIFALASKKLVKLMGHTVPAVPEGVTWVKLPTGAPGQVAANDDGHIFVQNYLPVPEKPVQRSKKKKEKNEIRPGMSYIVHVNPDGEPVWTMGQDGLASEPFESIIRMDTLEGDSLYVLHRRAGRKVLSYYEEGSLLSSYDAFTPGSVEERKKYFIEIEDMVPAAQGQYVLVSAAFRHKDTHAPVYRQIYRVYASGDAEQLLFTEDPADYFAWSRPDGGFYMMNSEEDGSRILFKIYNNRGEYLSNRLIIFPELRESWRETYLTLQNKIYTSRLQHGNFELYEWK